MYSGRKNFERKLIKDVQILSKKIATELKTIAEADEGIRYSPTPSTIVSPAPYSANAPIGPEPLQQQESKEEPLRGKNILYFFKCCFKSNNHDKQGSSAKVKPG